VSSLAEVTGSLTPGKKADMIVLRADDLNLGPINVADGEVVLATQPRNVKWVWIDGVVRKRDGIVMGFDVPEAMRKARDAVASLSACIGSPVGGGGGWRCRQGRGTRPDGRHRSPTSH
jgi:5-methylthioadenosine/S-adenosylhomocysteine deaminase